MKLLIVDDQVSVVRGLVQGVNWCSLGFTTVDTAFNAVDAKASLLKQEAEVMLCDIEMPMESGLDLLAWMRTNGMKTRCIFLTAYAKFDYAQEAMHLGGFDYIVQPAPYAEIVKVVEKAVQEVRSEQLNEELKRRGEIFDRRQEAIVDNLLREYLTGNAPTRDLETFERMGLIPMRNRNAWGVLLQPLRWTKGPEPWDVRFLSVAVGNMAGEIFAPLEMLAVTAAMPQDQCLALVLQSKAEDEVDTDVIMRQLIYLQSACEQYVAFTSAIYLDGPRPFGEMAAVWRLLVSQKNDNVGLKSGVFTARNDNHAEPRAFHIRQIASWQRLMQQGYAAAVEQEACQLLDTLVAENQMDSVTLRYFYHDYLQMLFNDRENNPDRIREMFQEPEALELYRNGVKTVDDMKALIHYVTERQGTGTKDENGFVEQVCNYIAEHLESELRREELANVVHLNADYLTRLFKKKTGQTLKEYVIEQKMQEARSLLRTTNLPISFIAAKVGYVNFSHFSNSYKKIFNKSPQEDRQNQ